MSENQTKSSPKETSLVSSLHTILATENKTSELYVKCFQYQGENVATKHLGQIFGFFEIPDTQEDNAYIVNFLASVVKKEYFVNPKRSTTDSFEAALHKINLALTELVKQGNTGWLGNLHGVVSVLENNTLHFSVTGDAAILLYRENSVTTISEGLADKDAALHPLKTFLEISSGAVRPNDKILITSPELFTLVPPDTLLKNAFRMDKSGFARFVRAALVNELSLGVSIIVDIEEELTKPTVKSKAKELREQSIEKLQNVFSGNSFEENTSSETEPDIEIAEAPIEYTDSKTGHIYVQGEYSASDLQELTRWQLLKEEKLLPFLKNTSAWFKRLTKKSRKNITRQASVLSSEGIELSQRFWQNSRSKSASLARRSNSALKERITSFKKPRTNKDSFITETDSDIFLEESALPLTGDAEPITLVPALNETEDTLSEENDPLQDRRQAALQKFSPHYKRPPRIALVNKISARAKKSLATVSEFKKKRSEIDTIQHSKFSRIFSQKKIFFIIGGILLLLILVIVTWSFSRSQESALSPETPTTANNENSETNVISQNKSTLSDPVTLATWEQYKGILAVKSENSFFVVLPKSIISGDKNIPFPADGTIQAATYMPDLQTIFLWSTNKELVAWNIVDQKFTANIFPVSTGVNVSSLGSYLTYLYALDKENGTVSRFARIEGGFSGPTTWLKSPLSKNSTQEFAVTDTIRIATTASVDQYLQGNKEKTLGEGLYQILGLSAERNLTLAVNSETGKITVWNNDGTQVYDDTFEALKGISTVTYSESTKKLYVAKDQNLLEYPLSW